MQDDPDISSMVQRLQDIFYRQYGLSLKKTAATEILAGVLSGPLKDGKPFPPATDALARNLAWGAVEEFFFVDAGPWKANMEKLFRQLNVLASQHRNDTDQDAFELAIETEVLCGTAPSLHLALLPKQHFLGAMQSHYHIIYEAIREVASKVAALGTEQTRRSLLLACDAVSRSETGEKASEALRAVFGLDTAEKGRTHVVYSGPLRKRDKNQSDPSKWSKAPQAYVARAETELTVDVFHQNPGLKLLGFADQMSLSVESRGGVPCLHVSNSRGGPRLLSIVFTREGLYLSPAPGHSLVETPPDAPGRFERAQNALRECGLPDEQPFVLFAPREDEELLAVRMLSPNQAGPRESDKND